MDLQLILCILVFAPLVGFVINGLAGKQLGHAGAGLVAISAVLIPFALSVMLYLQDLTGTVSLWDWLPLGNTVIGFDLAVDHLTMLMLMVVTGVGTLIHVYSTGYMHDDEGFAKFLAYLNLFIFFMLILVLGANFPMLFIGWEGGGKVFIGKPKSDKQKRA